VVVGPLEDNGRHPEEAFCFPVVHVPPNRVGLDPKTSHLGMRVSVEKGTHKVNVDSSGVILKGYDPVAYFVQNKAVKGSSKYRSTYQERERLGSRLNKQQLKA
jgi:hypothetical protein